jgi:phospholipid-transporting ATPase
MPACRRFAIMLTSPQYSFENAFSGQVIYESWTLSFYNVLFTVLPPLVMGIFDQFISARLLDRYPQLYQLGQKGQFVCYPMPFVLRLRPNIHSSKWAASGLG